MMPKKRDAALSQVQRTSPGRLETGSMILLARSITGVALSVFLNGNALPERRVYRAIGVNANQANPNRGFADHTAPQPQFSE